MSEYRARCVEVVDGSLKSQSQRVSITCFYNDATRAITVETEPTPDDDAI